MVDYLWSIDRRTERKRDRSSAKPLAVFKIHPPT